MQLFKGLPLEDQWFSNSREHQKHLQDLFKYTGWPNPHISRFSKSEEEPENLLSSQTPRWCLYCGSRDHTLRSSTPDSPGKGLYTYHMRSEKTTVCSNFFAYRQSVSFSLAKWGLEATSLFCSPLRRLAKLKRFSKAREDGSLNATFHK